MRALPRVARKQMLPPDSSSIELMAESGLAEALWISWGGYRIFRLRFVMKLLHTVRGLKMDLCYRSLSLFSG